MNKMIKDALILFAITLVSGLGLGAVYNVTSQARAEQEQKTKNAAYQAVFDGADHFDEYKINDSDQKKIADYIKKMDTDEVKANGASDINADINEIMEAKDKDNNVLGYVITVTDNEAYDGKIQFSVGIKEDGTVNGISFLSISETPGLGMRAKEDSYKNQFNDKKVDYFKYSKTGASEDNEIDAMSGATITTNATTNGVNAAIFCFKYITGGAE
ncbi:RnfABCDGE type electron transport complex subunit G [Eubacterium sp.]